ncbi:MAG: OmpH family outer membrane protein [bacterium]
MQEETITSPVENQEPAPRKTNSSFFVFNFNTVLGLFLLAGLIVLYFLHFSGRSSSSTVAPLTIQKASGSPLSVVFVNIDSLNTHYEYVKILRNDLESTGKRLQTEVLSEQSALEKEANEFQRQVAANIIPEEKAKLMYEQLMQKQQALMQKKEHYTQQVADQEMSMNLRLVDSVTAFLKRFNRQYKFDYIMGFKAGGEILISNDTLDITKSVLEELNKEYHQRKK